MLMVISFEGKNQRGEEFGSYDTEGHSVPSRDSRVLEYTVLGYWDLQVFQSTKQYHANRTGGILSLLPSIPNITRIVPNCQLRDRGS